MNSNADSRETSRNSDDVVMDDIVSGGNTKGGSGVGLGGGGGGVNSSVNVNSVTIKAN